ncbi:MAG: MerR family transcriptional regulator [Bacteroidales bacterium]|jgi:DNA-binding transcriptional MerR regulator|nr:MerR family transcriptional regulator [Bacteroidales bacterium]
MEEEKLYYSIGEVSLVLEVSLPTLRFWEKEFKQIKPQKNKRGVRYYTMEDISLLKQIKYLTKTCGYTLEGTKNILKNKTLSLFENKEENKDIEMVENLKEIKDFLLELKNML